MKAKVINESSKYFQMIIPVKLASSCHIFGYIPGTRTKVQVPYEDVELIFEHEWEKSAVKYKNLLDIRLPRAASMRLYAAICFVLEQHFNGIIKSISVVRDIEEKVRKGYWYKNIDIMVNSTHPMNIRITGKNYANLYDINIEDMDIESFVSECTDDINKLKELISKSSEKLRLYEKVMYEMKNPPADGSLKAIEGI